MIVLTKADLLSGEDLARSIQLVLRDVRAYLRRRVEYQVNGQSRAEQRQANSDHRPVIEQCNEEDDDQEDDDNSDDGNESNDEEEIITSAGVAVEVLPISAATGAGVRDLWQHLVRCVRADTLPIDAAAAAAAAGEPANPRAVREHRRAHELRQATISSSSSSSSRSGSTRRVAGSDPLKVTGKLRRAVKK